MHNLDRADNGHHHEAVDVIGFNSVGAAMPTRRPSSAHLKRRREARGLRMLCRLPGHAATGILIPHLRLRKPSSMLTGIGALSACLDHAPIDGTLPSLGTLGANFRAELDTTER